MQNVTTKQMVMVGTLFVVVVGGLWYGSAKLFEKAVDAVVPPAEDIPTQPED